MDLDVSLTQMLNGSNGDHIVTYCNADGTLGEPLTYDYIADGMPQSRI
jgi:hypothetical protein